MTMPASSVGVLRIHRGELIAVGIIGITLGIIGLVWQGATLLTVAIILGNCLIASGIFRITAAFVAECLSTGLRWFTGALRLLVIAAGILCLADPFTSLTVLAFAIGIGWIRDGVIDFKAGGRAVLLIEVSITTLLTLPRRNVGARSAF